MNCSVNIWFISKTLPVTLNCVCWKLKSSDRNSSICYCCSPSTTPVQSNYLSSITSERWAAVADHYHLKWWATCCVCRSVACYNNALINSRPNLFITVQEVKEMQLHWLRLNLEKSNKSCYRLQKSYSFRGQLYFSVLWWQTIFWPKHFKLN